MVSINSSSVLYLPEVCQHFSDHISQRGFLCDSHPPKSPRRDKTLRQRERERGIVIVKSLYTFFLTVVEIGNSTCLSLLIKTFLMTEL